MIGNPSTHKLSTLKIVGILLGLVLLTGAIGVLWLNSERASGFRAEIKELILKELTKGNPLPSGKVVNAIYVLGGSEISLRYKYQTAAEFYNNQVTDKILILSQSGITRFSIQNSIDTQTLSETLIEFLKLKFYQHLLL